MDGTDFGRHVAVALALCLAGLLSWALISTAAGIHASHAPSGAVYTMPTLRAHLTRDPAAWMGQTVVVRAIVEPCPWWGAAARRRECADRPLVLLGAPTESPAAPLPLVLPAPHTEVPAAPMPLALLAPGTFLADIRDLPLLRSLLPAPRVLQPGALATYRVRLLARADGICGAGVCYEAVLLDAAP